MLVELQRARHVADNHTVSYENVYSLRNIDMRLRPAAEADILQDLLRPGLRLVFCGTAPSTRSAAVGAYYAGPGNKFWRTLHAVGLTPRLLTPGEWRALDALDIGFTDLVKRHSGMDKDLPPDSFDAARVRASIEKHQPNALAFNGKAAAKAFFGLGAIEYGLQDGPIGRTAVWVLPSTSGAASGAWSIDPWQALARYVAGH
jgi:double-stranded uracil-DNA glycosylase